jgi:hypothetical protein
LVFEDPLSSIKDYLISLIRNNSFPQLSEAIEILQKDQLWKLTLEYKTPLSWNKLASDISEVV